MFYITNTTGVRSPYRVESIDKERKEKEANQQFGEESEAEHHEKFLKASEKLYKERTVLVAKQIMNEKLLPLKENLSLNEAWELIHKHQIEYFPIIRSDGKLIGLLSEKQILRKISENQGKKTLKEILSDQTLCADSNTSLQEVMDVFSKEDVEAIPIIDVNQCVIGILSRNDLLHTMLKVSQIKL